MVVARGHLPLRPKRAGFGHSGWFNAVETPTAPALTALADYWVRLAQTCDGRPGRADLDLMVLKPHLHQIFLLDVLDGGDDFRFRLVGTGVVEKLGRDSTGRRWSELDFADQGEALRTLWRHALKRPAPTFATGEIGWRAGMANLPCESLHLPLYAGEQPVMLLNALAWA